MTCGQLLTTDLSFSGGLGDRRWAGGEEEEKAQETTACSIMYTGGVGGGGGGGRGICISQEILQDLLGFHHLETLSTKHQYVHYHFTPAAFLQDEHCNFPMRVHVSEL